ncbi:MAG: stage II sporulation protein M [Opitutales bacterium]
MILDVEQFIQKRQSDWSRYEALLQVLEDRGGHKLSLDEVAEFHSLYEKLGSDLVRLKSAAFEPTTRVYLETLLARGFGELHGSRRSKLSWRALMQAVLGFARVVRRHAGSLGLCTALFVLGGAFGGLALALDPDSKPILMPFGHLLGSPNERVDMEESQDPDFMDGHKSSFSAELMTHNTKVAIFTLTLGITFGVGTCILIFYNGAVIGAVVFDYILAGETVFLTGWLLPHGSVEIPAILLAGQGGLMIGKALLFARDQMNIAARLQAIRGDLVCLIAGIAVMLIWAGIVESFFSQYHYPVLPCSVKIAFGAVQLSAVCAYFILAGRKAEKAEVPA